MAEPNYFRPVFSVALTVLLAVLLIQRAIDSIRAVWQSSTINRVALAAMFLCLAVWLLGWVVFDAFESAELDKVGTPVRPSQQLGAYALAILVACAFAGMVIAVANIPVFVSLFAAVVLGSSIGDHLVIRGFTGKVVKAKRPVGEHLIHYYTKRPHMLLHCLQLFLVALAGAVYSFLIRGGGPSNEWVAYLILSVSIVTNEGVLWAWRKEDRFDSSTQKR